MKPEYLRQEDGWHCFILALCNARRYFGLDSPEPHTAEYEDLIDLGRARSGPCIRTREVAEHLGLRISPIDPEDITKDRLPVILVANIPQSGARHASLIVDIKGDEWQVVNYEIFFGDTLKWVDKVDIKQCATGFFPIGNQNRKCYEVHLA